MLTDTMPCGGETSWDMLVASALDTVGSFLPLVVGVEGTIAEPILVTSARVSANEKSPVVEWRNFICEGAADGTVVQGNAKKQDLDQGGTGAIENEDQGQEEYGIQLLYVP